MKAITNATIYTMAGSVINHGSILWQGSKIIEIGESIDFPAGTEIYDAQGGTIIPGMINAHCQAGLKETYVDYVAGDDSNEISMPITPHLNSYNGINPDDEIFLRLRQAGVTSVAVAPGNANILGGSVTIIKTHGVTIDEMVVREKAGIKASMGNRPKRFYSIKPVPPKTRMNIMAMLRQALYFARDYASAGTRVGEDIKAPPYNGIAESLIPILNKTIPLYVQANRRDDIFSALRLADEFNIEVILVNAAEAYLVADRLAKKQIKCVVAPGFDTRNEFELQYRSWSCLGELAAAGVATAIVPDSTYLSSDNIYAIAVMLRQSGMPLTEILKSLTIQPARILGISDQMGSLAAGKDADLVVFSGEPFGINSQIKKVIINGQVIGGTGGRKNVNN